MILLSLLGSWSLILFLTMMKVPGYFLVLRKMPLDAKTAIIPFLAERQMAKVLFRLLRSFYRPFIISAVFICAAVYLSPQIGMGKIFMMIAVVVYGWFLIRLYWKLGKSFGKGVFFRILLILFPQLFLIVLGLSRAEYTPLELKPVKQFPKWIDWLIKGLIALISGAEIIALVAVVGFITIRTHMPGPMVDWMLEDFHDKTKDVTGTEEVVSREDAMGSDAALIDTMEVSREKYFPDHSQDKSVVVLAYIVGADLEDRGGYASANIKQMIEATNKGDALKFIVQAGGSRRWFTGGIDRESYGRYEISGGSLQKIEDLPDDTCMSEQKSLEDFLLWAKDKYTADRKMLVLWDHGGGVAMGYGQDDLNKKRSKDSSTCMNTSEVIKAIKKADMKFDVIGFDACLMQDLEIAAKLEPYTDYYLASEEVEGGYGWYYTSPFGKLAEDPGMSTEDFAVDLLSCFDQVNTIVKDDDGKPDTESTLSLVDTTLAKPAYEELVDFLLMADEILKEDSGAYADMAVAGSNAYNFRDDIQIDLIDYLTVLYKADYDDGIAGDEEIKDIINKLRASVLYRNKNSAEGVNGIAFAFPYKAIHMYSDTSRELKAMSLKSERKVFNDIFSIMAAQQKKAADQGESPTLEGNGDEEQGFLSSLVSMFGESDYTGEEWYVKGFEDYSDVDMMIDIPLTEMGGEYDEYKIELPEQAWDIITDCQTMVWKETGKKGNLQYLGKDQVGGVDDEGHPTITMDEKWVHIGGELVCYEADPVRLTEDSEIFTGKVRARLNDDEDIMLTIEWDPVEEGADGPVKGHITGYYPIDTHSISDVLNSRVTQNLNTGDTIQFIFDICDPEGKIIKTAPSGKTIRVIKQSDLSVEDAPMKDCDIVFNGVLTDVYQRTMTTEQLEVHID